MEACIEHHNSSNILSDTPDDGLDLYSTSPISCTSSSSETSEEEDEEHKNHHQQHRKEIDELKKKLEIETTQDNDPELTNETAPNNEKAINYSAEAQLRITYQKETFKGEELQKSASLDIPTESKGENGNDYENPQKLARSPFKDNAGILERYRHLSERSWSSTSSGELSSFDDTKFRPTTSPYHQESPVSWMPTCLSLSRRGSISESNDGASEDGDVLAAKACDADSQFVGTRHLGIINSKGHLDPSHMPRGQKDPESPRRIKLKKLNRELSNIKRKLEELANEFENSPGGYRLSHVEKQKHKPMRKLLSEQSRLKRQIRNCRESNFGDVDDDITSMNNQLASAGNVGNPSQLSVDQTIMSVSRTSSRRSSWSSNRDMAFDDSGISGPSISPSPLQLEYTPTLITTPTTSTSSILSSSPGGSSITSSSSGNSSILSFSSSGESSMSLGDRSSGLASEIDDADDENRSDIVISDNEDSNSIISQTMLSVMKKDFDSTPFREKTSFTDIGIISAVNNSSVSKDVSFGNLTNDVELKNNNNSANRNLESMRNSLIDVEQRLKAQRVVAGRPYDLDAMNPDQLLHEKVDLQSALLQFEHLFGHPETQEEKALVKDVYDRYRSVKRHIRRSSSIRSKDPLELETIPEDLEIPLTLASPQVLI
jgi:DNA-binding transcriptional MerR regulator